MSPIRSWSIPPESKKEMSIPEASIDDERFISLVTHKQDPNYILILDRSENSQKVLSLVRKNGPIDLVKRVNEAFVKSWEKVTSFQYLILHGQWGYTGGLSIECRTLEHY